MPLTPKLNAQANAFLGLLERRAPRPLSITEMARALELDRYDPKHLKAVLETEVANHKLRRIGKTRYQWIREAERVTAAGRGVRTPGIRGEGGKLQKRPAPRIEGHYSRVRAGYGFVEVLGQAADRFPRDVLIPAGMAGAALHGDRVAVEIIRRDLRARRFVGRITAVTGPVHEKIIGTLRYGREGWHLLPENELLPVVAIIGRDLPEQREAGQVALVRLTRPPTPTRGPGGELEEVLGAADDPEVQFLTIAFEHGLRIEFPPEVLAEAERLPPDPSEHDFAGREDLRRLPFMTIDGESARDFDDAVCLEPLPHGGYRLWVAIADVSHYVRPGSALDAEAARRCTSVYFPDRAIPMLPPQLSNQLCSLNPERDRLVMVAELTYDRRGHRQEARFYRAVIISRARLTYANVAAVLSEADTLDIRRWRDELSSLLPQLRLMLELMRKLLHKRTVAGSLDLDLPEAFIDLSEEGRSVGVRLFQRNDAHRLIEEFMLEANCAVAAFLTDRHVPFPYRIHEPPDPDDIDDLNEFLQVFGFAVNYDGDVRPQDVQHLLEQLDGHPLSRVLSRLVLRSLKQAQYSIVNAGHFGLAFPVYCHFTSPIRRYPDLIVHRQLSRVFDGQVEAARSEAEAVEAASIQSSQCEREAMEAERAMLDLKKAEFMLDHLLEPHPGTIVSVLSFGFFVELDAYPIEGLVRADALTDDRYYFIEEERALKGMRTGRRFRLGDRVLVEATTVSLRRREIDFAVLERLRSAGANAGPRYPRQEKKKRPTRGRQARGQKRPRNPGKR
ncbi:MAG: ribonuclease R [Candidatus Binatia bacterium]